jgi:hypothetical protein
MNSIAIALIRGGFGLFPPRKATGIAALFAGTGPVSPATMVGMMPGIAIVLAAIYLVQSSLGIAVT